MKERERKREGRERARERGGRKRAENVVDP